MWCHRKVSSVTIDYRWAHLSERIYCAVDTVAYTQVISRYCDRGVFTFVDRTSFVNSCDHDSTVNTITDLHEGNIGIYVDVAVLTTCDSYIFVLE